MIPQTIAAWQTSSWKDELREAVTDVGHLLEILGLSDSELSCKVTRSSHFPLRVPRSFINRMKPGDPEDPLLLQVLPLAREQEERSGFSKDPLQEQNFNPVSGIIHKYSGRALVVTTPACAINCRYCFRRHFSYSANNPGKKHWLNSLEYIAREKSISELILSGGDPLTADDQHLSWLATEIEKIPHVRRLRIHSRFPVVIPSRIDEDLERWVTGTRLETVFVLHINHPNEIDDNLTAAITRLREKKVPVLNQSVLLKGVNDCVETLVELSERLFSSGVLPYYLHLLDPVDGAAHFDIPSGRARKLHNEMRKQLPGYLLPRLVRDVPGTSSKTHINSQI